MSNSSGITNVNKLEETISQLIDALRVLQTDILDMSTELNKMMKGDGNGAYWQGTQALKFYKSAITNLENNAADYNKSYGSINALALQVENLIREDRK